MNLLSFVLLRSLSLQFLVILLIFSHDGAEFLVLSESSLVINWKFLILKTFVVCSLWPLTGTDCQCRRTVINTFLLQPTPAWRGELDQIYHRQLVALSPLPLLVLAHLGRPLGPDGDLVRLLSQELHVILS